MQERYVDVGSGVRLHCNISNFGGGSSVLLIHGWAESSKIWLRYIKRSAGRLKIVAIDLKGFGDSDKPISGYGLPELADEAYIAARKLGISKASVVGHSMGGQIAMYIAIRHRDFVEKLVVVDSAEKPSKLVPIWLTDAKKDYKGLIRRVVPSLFDSISAADLKLFMGEGLKMTRDSVLGTLNSIMRMRLETKLGRINCPALLIFGIHDRNRSVDEIRALGKKLNGSKFIVIKGSRHCPMYENVEDFSKALDRFLNSKKVYG